MGAFTSKKRIAYFDIAKGIAIIFIIIFHTGLVFGNAKQPGAMPFSLVRFATTFHLPVFFAVSGYFFAMSKKLDKSLVKKDARNLLLPYFVTCALIICATTAIAFFSPTASARVEFVRWLQASLWGAGARTNVALWDVERIGGIWFLWALFWAHIFISATHKLSIRTRTGIMILGILVATVSAQFVWLPCSIQSGVECALYLWAGMLAKEYDIFSPGRIKPWMWATAAALWGVCIIWGGMASLAMCVYPLGAMDVIGGIAAALCIVGLCRELEKHADKPAKFLAWIGRNTLAIFCLHIFEDSIIAWGVIGGNLSAALHGNPLTWVVLLLIRFSVDAVLVAIAYRIPFIRTVYFPQLRAKPAASAVEQGKA